MQSEIPVIDVGDLERLVVRERVLLSLRTGFQAFIYSFMLGWTNLAGRQRTYVVLGFLKRRLHVDDLFVRWLLRGDLRFIPLRFVRLLQNDLIAMIIHALNLILIEMERVLLVLIVVQRVVARPVGVNGIDAAHRERPVLSSLVIWRVINYLLALANLVEVVYFIGYLLLKDGQSSQSSLQLKFPFVFLPLNQLVLVLNKRVVVRTLVVLAALFVYV